MIDASNMSAEEFETARHKLQLTQGQVARLIGVEIRTVRRWGAGDFEVPVGVAMILRLLIKHRIDVAVAYKLATGEKW